MLLYSFAERVCYDTIEAEEVIQEILFEVGRNGNGRRPCRVPLALIEAAAEVSLLRQL